MEKELVGLLGAGLASAASGYGVAVPVGAIDRGYALIDVLSRECGPRIGAILETMVQGLWLDWQRSGLDRDTTARHAGDLPAVVELNRPDPVVFQSAAGAAQPGRLVATDVLKRAKASGDIARAGLDDDTSFHLLEIVFRVVYRQCDELPELMAAVNLSLQSALWRERPEPVSEPAPAGASPPTIEPEAEAEPPSLPRAKDISLVSRLSSRATTKIRGIVDARGGHYPDPAARASELQADLVQLIERSTGLAQRAPDAARSLFDAARALADGEFTAADACYVAAQEALIQRASSNLAAARQLMQRAAELMELRGAFEEVRLDYRKAARHYRAAIRCLPAAEVAGIRRLLALQGAALMSLDKLHEDANALADAAKVFAEAADLALPATDVAMQAHTQMQLARLLVDLGLRRSLAADYVGAAGRAGRALQLYTQIDAAADVEEARLLMANALWLGADRTNAIELLDAAAQTYRDVLIGLRREKQPERWVEASSRLGQVLLRTASARVEPQLLPAAIEHLRGASQFASTCNVAFDALATEAALGRALLAEYAAGGQALLLDLAATAFRRAIKAAAKDGKAIEKAGLQHELGMTLWAVSEVAAAVEVMEQSLTAFENMKEPSRAASVKADLARIRAVATA